MTAIPEGLTLARNKVGDEYDGLLAFWWTVPLATVRSNPEVPGDLLVHTVATDSQFTREGIGTLNGWLPVASAEDIKAALDEA